MIAQNSEVYNPPTYLFSLYTYMEKDLCRGVVYFTVLCDHPYLVSLLYAVLVSLHPVTFSNVFYYFCQMYPQPFGRMNGAKYLVFMIWTVL